MNCRRGYVDCGEDDRMLTDGLYRLKKSDVPHAAETLKNAFEHDPLWAAVFKQGPKRDTQLTGFFTCPVLYGLKYGKVYAPSPALEGVAAWLPGRYANMTMARMMLCGALPYGAKMSAQQGRFFAALGKTLEREKKKLLEGKPFVYLSVIGIAQSAQGQGYGSRLVNAIKEECDRDGAVLYLETETEENVHFYEKHGFRVLQKLTLDEVGLPLWQMARVPGRE